MPQVAISTSSQLAADAAARIAEEGGNAVDAAVAASLVSAISEPGMVALGAGGFLTIWPATGDAVSVDGAVEMPGRGLSRGRLGRGGIEVSLDYLGGMRTVIGPASVATPGALAGYALASERYGLLPWRELVMPAVDVAREGFALPPTAHAYLTHSHLAIFGRAPDGFRALHDERGELIGSGERVRVAHLADSLETIAAEGADSFYRGDLAALIADHVVAEGGILSRRDLAEYRAAVGMPVRFRLGEWVGASAAPPSVGGALLGAMVRLGAELPHRAAWTEALVARLIRIQDRVLSFRTKRLDHADDFGDRARRFFEQADRGLLDLAAASPSTVHTCTVDNDGLACSVTISAGYGSGVMPPGTGIWLNNCLGEMELNRRGFQALEPGSRLLSNMAPTVVRSTAGHVLAIGSPGSDRITTAQAQVLFNHLMMGMSLADAVAHPRLHVEPSAQGPIVAVEPGLPATPAGLRTRVFEHKDLYFGGVGAARHNAGGRFDTVADPRRSGATAVAGHEV